MRHHELFLMNYAYVFHPNKRIPTRLCPRDEIAHPNKIIDAIYFLGKRWRNTFINNYKLKYKRIEYQKEFYEDVVSSHFYVVVEDISIIKDAARVNKSSYEDILAFLSKHQNTLFMITTPIFHLIAENEPNQRYTIPINVLQEPIFFEDNNTTELAQVIDGECYTVCNGLTLVLAMIRSNTWDIGASRMAIKKWDHCYKTQPENVDMTAIWQYLYTNHPIPMIAEFPIYYAAMYPSVPVTFFKYLETEDSVPLTQFVHDTDEESNSFYATPITSMFPYFNRSIFDYYNPKFIESDNIDTIFESPFELENDDYQQIDIEGFFISIIRSRRAWRWWKKNGATYLRKLWKTNNSSYSFFSHCMMILFYLYSKPYLQIKYPLWRIRVIWNMIIPIFNISSYDIQIFITIHIIRNVIYDIFNIQRIHSKVPLAFMIDILKTQSESLNWFESHQYKLYTTHDMNTIIAIFSPYIQIKNESTHEYILNCSLYQFMKLDPNFSDIFINHIMYKRIIERLQCIDKMFGIKMNDKNKLNLSENNAYLIGMIMKEYLREHRNMLI